MSAEPEFEVFSPQPARPRARRKSLAPRLDTLDGKTVAEVWDYQYRGDEIFGWLEEELRQRFPAVRFVHWSEFGSTHSRNEREVVAGLAARFRELRVDAAISGIGA